MGLYWPHRGGILPLPEVVFVDSSGVALPLSGRWGSCHLEVYGGNQITWKPELMNGISISGYSPGHIFLIKGFFSVFNCQLKEKIPSFIYFSLLIKRASWVQMMERGSLWGAGRGWEEMAKDRQTLMCALTDTSWRLLLESRQSNIFLINTYFLFSSQILH